ncbi:MAG: DUF3617 domain-containing protein [Pedobacter sp.]|nr:DUF3617 domain-containing protein [Pedobacter sp.]
MKSRLLFALSLLCIPLSSLADEQWETTTTMQSSAFPMQMPPTTTRVCVPDGQYDKPSEKMIPTENDCKVTSFKVSGNTSNFRVECPSPKMVGDGSFTRKSATAFNGTMAMKGDFGDGKQGDMRITFDSKKLGKCTAEKMPDYAALANAQVAAACTDGVKKMQKELFVGPYAPDFCKSHKPKFCAQVKSFLAKGSDPEQLRGIANQREDWEELADACGIDGAALRTTACSKASSTRNWGAVAEFCPEADVRSIARENCTGRSYTSIMTGEYGPICQAYSDEVKVAGGSNSKSGGVMDSANKAVDGFNKLRGLFGK